MFIKFYIKYIIDGILNIYIFIHVYMIITLVMRINGLLFLANTNYKIPYTRCTIQTLYFYFVHDCYYKTHTTCNCSYNYFIN